MNYDLDTKTGRDNAIAWTQQMFSCVKDGGVWMVPRSGTMVRINHQEKIATITVGFAPDPSLKRVIEAMGWAVVMK